MYVIVGLGNPGKKYDLTRHNIGFECIDHLAEKHQIKVTQLKHKALLGEGLIGGEKVILVKPQTFMNLSGETVLSLVHYYKVPFEKLIVVYDDIDTDFGKIRIRPRGSSGTHNGMRHIIYMIQSEDFARVRLGIGRSNDIPLKNFVLQKFSKDEMKVAVDLIQKGAEAIEKIIEENVDTAMNLFNGK